MIMRLVVILLTCHLAAPELATILPKTFAHWRESKLYNSELDIRKNLKRPASRNYIDTHSYYTVIQCDGFKHYQVICVECQKFTKLQRHADKCNGEGQMLKMSHFTDFSSYRGKWIKLTPTIKGKCFKTSLSHYVFI